MGASAGEKSWLQTHRWRRERGIRIPSCHRCHCKLQQHHQQTLVTLRCADSLTKYGNSSSPYDIIIGIEEDQRKEKNKKKEDCEPHTHNTTQRTRSNDAFVFRSRFPSRTHHQLIQIENRIGGVYMHARKTYDALRLLLFQFERSNTPMVARLR